MGYKLAGYEVIGNLEIDENTNNCYIKNLSPKNTYCMDIRDFNKTDIPKQFSGIDILDGSPPCTSFSMTGHREADWGKQKVFSEGNKLQTLDDLFLDFLDTAEKMKPKAIIAENVKGIILGAAKGYCNLILKRLDALGYNTQMFLLNAATMGVPQSRERVFFVSAKKEFNLPKLKLQFNERPVLFGEVRTGKGIPLTEKSKQMAMLIKHRKKSDKSLADIKERIGGKRSMFSQKIIFDDEVSSCIVSGSVLYRGHDGQKYSVRDYANCATFPQDYAFTGKTAQFLCGMCVPPIMMYRIAEQVKIQWLDKITTNQSEATNGKI